MRKFQQNPITEAVKSIDKTLAVDNGTSSSIEPVDQFIN